MASTQLPAKPPAAKPPSKATRVRDLLAASRAKIVRALPRHFSADRMMQITMTSLHRTPELLECDPISLIGAVIQSAQLGLEPDGVLGHAYLVPFFNGKAQRMEVQFIPGYKGLVDLARRSGQISTIYAEIVREGDVFDLAMGLDPKLVHIPARDGGGEPIAAYAVARLKDGGAQFAFLWLHEIEKVKRSSKSSKRDSSPWNQHFEEMAKKTAIRRLCKLLPSSVELQKAVAYDELASAGISQDLASLIPMDHPDGGEISIPLDEIAAGDAAPQSAADDLLNPQAVTEPEPPQDEPPARKARRQPAPEPQAAEGDSDEPQARRRDPEPAQDATAAAPKASRALSREALHSMVKSCSTIKELTAVRDQMRPKLDADAWEWFEQILINREDDLAFEADAQQTKARKSGKKE
jgi:recombination protein RecT